MLNPWKTIENTKPWVLAGDEPYVRMHNRLLDGEPDNPHYIHLDAPPSPFVGNFDAPLVVLLANPGWEEEDERQQGESNILPVILDGLRSDSGGEFWPLREDFVGDWWRRRTREIATALGGGRPDYKPLLRNLLVIELHGYHSKSWFAPRAQFPSQRFAEHLVRRAMRNGALIVAARAQKDWYSLVPTLPESEGLYDYPNLIRGTKSSRSAYLSPGNLGDVNFDLVVAAIKSAG